MNGMTLVVGGSLWLAALLTLALAAGAAARAGESAPGRLTAEGPFPILAWIGPPAEETTVERYREMADAGFTHSFSFFGDVAAMAKALGVAQAAGIKLFVCTPDLAKDPEGVARGFRDHPAVAGYHLRDEPNAKDFAALAKLAKAIQSVDAKHWCYINLFPTYASPQQLGTPTYQEHVDRFIAEVPVEVISFDHYPVVGNGLRADWYQNLETIARGAEAAKKPFWAFTLAVAHGPYPIPTLAHLRLQIFSDLAYGAQGIQYFTYWTPPPDGGFRFHDGPIEKNGKRTPVYELAKQVNREIQGLAGVFLGAKVLSVGHTGKLPAGTRAYAPAAPISGLKTEGNGAVASLLAKGQRRFLAVVNRDFNAPMPLTVALDGSAAVARVDKTGAVHAVDGKEFTGRLEPGDLVVLTWELKQ